VEEKREIEDRKKQVVKGAHLVVAGEEAEGTTARDAENTFDGCGGRGDEFGVARVGHGWREIKQCLLTVLEVRRDNELACVGKAETAAEMLKARPETYRARTPPAIAKGIPKRGRMHCSIELNRQ